MRETLRSKFFPSKEEEQADEQADRDAANKLRHDLRTFLESPGTRNFRTWLANAIVASRPQPSGDVGVMNYQLGVQAGLQTVVDEFTKWELAAKEQ